MFSADKPVKKYVWMNFYRHEDPVGHRVVLQREDQAGTTRMTVTSKVITYDETMGIIETLNTVYIPAGPGAVDANPA